MILIGLTGGIASGKSTVARSLAARGAVVIDADAIGHAVIAPGGVAAQDVIAEFGPEILGTDGSIDRTKLAAIVFADSAERARLEAISHPAIYREISRLIEEQSASDSLVVLDAPLLVETLTDRGRSLGLDALVVVNSWPADQIERMMADRGMTTEDAEARIAAQTTAESRLALADYVIDNRGSFEELETAVGLLWDDLRARFGGPKPSSA